jgi:hypothetical protein
MVLFAVTIAFSPSLSSESLTAFDQQLIAQQKQLLQDTMSRNETAINHAVASDFRGIAPNGDFYDKSELVDAVDQNTSEKIRAYDFQVVKLNNEAAVVAYNLIVTGKHPRYRHMTDTWAKIDGRWQLKFRQITPNLWSANDLD